ncbi:hypothetical protein GQ54DRAFT_297889 [Martensiomyces pterosporus]|nr:hypothetical protein GQ54DRAFT_297889 [Martensiomyces pterosporus]
MYSIIYRIPILSYIVTADFSKLIRPGANWLDWFAFHLHRPAGRYGPKWDKSAGELDGILRIEVLKGKGLPRSEITSTFNQYVCIRVGDNADYCDTVANSNGEPAFRMKSFFKKHLYTNTLAEITVFNDGLYKDTMVGRVTIPVKELHDVRMHHGWLCLDDAEGNPIGFVYVSCVYRRSGDSGFRGLEDEANQVLEGDGIQLRRQRNWLRKKRPDLTKPSTAAASARDSGSTLLPATSMPVTGRTTQQGSSTPIADHPVNDAFQDAPFMEAGGYPMQNLGPRQRSRTQQQQ